MTARAIVALLVLVCGVIHAQPARAGTIWLAVTPPAPRSPPHSTLEFEDRLGEMNAITVTMATPTAVRIRDEGAPLVLGGPTVGNPERPGHCEVVTPNEVVCLRPGEADFGFGNIEFGRTHFDLGSGDDRLDLSAIKGDATAFAAAFGGPGNDVILAPQSHGARFDGGPGDDRLRGGSGGDILIGDAGDDLLDGQAGNDTLDGDSTDGRITVGNDRLLGGGGKDRLTIRQGTDRADGGAGNDTYTVYLLGRIRSSIITDTGRSVVDMIRACASIVCAGHRNCGSVRFTAHLLSRGAERVRHSGIERHSCRG